MEVAAGNDIVAFRKQFGKRMAFRGGIDKRSLAAGGKENARRGYARRSPLLVDGGFIPGCGSRGSARHFVAELRRVYAYPGAIAEMAVDSDDPFHFPARGEREKIGHTREYPMTQGSRYW